MISHKEAEILISARQDAPLDPLVERELQAHLAVCSDCRAFAIATERLTAGIRAMPSLPPDARLRDEVMEEVRGARRPFSQIFGSGPMSGSLLPAAAMLAIVLFVGWIGIRQLTPQQTDDAGELLAARPTAAIVVTPTTTMQPAVIADEAPTATATSIPTRQATAVVSPMPTATAAATKVPTATLTPTVPTVSGLPSGTMVPTATPSQTPISTRTVATSTPPPTPAPTDMPTDLALQQSTATSIPAAEKATVTPVPATETPTATEVPRIEPIDDDDSESETASGGEEIQPIPSDEGGELSELPTSMIESLDSSDSAESESAEDSVVADTNAADVERYALSQNIERFTPIDGDPANKLGLTPGGKLEFMPVPDGASVTTNNGYLMRASDTQPGVILLCGVDFCESALPAPEDAGWRGDAPFGVVGNTVYVLRMYDDRSEIIGGIAEATQIANPAVVTEIGAVADPFTVYVDEDMLMTWLPSGEWLEIRAGQATRLPGAYASPRGVRFAPLATNGPLMGYFSGGSLIIAPVSAPDAAILSLEVNANDFDVAAPGDHVAVIMGSDIYIYNIDGTLKKVFEGGDLQPVTLIWLRGGIVFLDANSGQLYQIPSTSP